MIINCSLHEHFLLTSSDAVVDIYLFCGSNISVANSQHKSSVFISSVLNTVATFSLNHSVKKVIPMTTPLSHPAFYSVPISEHLSVHRNVSNVYSANSALKVLLRFLVCIFPKIFICVTIVVCETTLKCSKQGNPLPLNEAMDNEFPCLWTTSFLI